MARTDCRTHSYKLSCQLAFINRNRRKHGPKSKAKASLADNSLQLYIRLPASNFPLNPKPPKPLNSHPACLGRSHPLLGWSDTEETRQPPIQNGRIETLRAPPVQQEVQLWLPPPFTLDRTPRPRRGPCKRLQA